MVDLADRTQVPQAIGNRPAGVAYGMGRSYGDACLNPNGILWNTARLDRFVAFDEASGRLVCEAGVTLADIHRLTVPRGWMLPVTPGTQLVTVGGAIANDIHGKNHTAMGTFGAHVLQLELARTDGSCMVCGPGHEPAWFAATVGGLGLTGVIVQAELQLKQIPGPMLHTQTLPYESLAELFALSRQSIGHWEHTVAWIDCSSGRGNRGLFTRSKPSAMPQEQLTAAQLRPRRARTAPTLPAINAATIELFNRVYFSLGKRKQTPAVAPLQHVLYPLDHIHRWNRLYGTRGFYQHQCVLPANAAEQAIAQLMSQLSRARANSFLAVIKTFGSRASPGMLSFPMPGVTLAMDFVNQGDKTLGLLERLDAVVAAAGGRVYPAKDARMSRAFFESSYPLLPQFLAYRDPGISSAMSRRLMGQ